MGQYFKAICLDKNFKIENGKVKTCGKKVIERFCEPFEYNNFLKMMEHAYVGNLYVEAAIRMLYYCCQVNHVNAMPFVWCGDYAETSIKENEDFTVYDQVRFLKEKAPKATEAYRNFKTVDKPEVFPNFGKVKQNIVLVNYDKKEYVRIPSERPMAYTIHPLPILCADGNGNGGGDYHGTYMKYVGRWAYNRIGIVMCDNIPEGFKELKVNFKRK